MTEEIKIEDELVEEPAEEEEPAKEETLVDKYANFIAKQSKTQSIMRS